METTGLNYPVLDEQFDSNVEIITDEAAVQDYTQLSKDELLEELEQLTKNDETSHVRDEVDAIKIAFYKRHKMEVDAARKAFIIEGGNSEEFVMENDGREVRLKELLTVYRSKRQEQTKEMEAELEANYKLKLSIVDKIKALVSSEESIGETFNTFKTLQTEWKAIGSIPKAYMNDLWETYHLCCEQFYDFVKINKELRDLDLKKNLENKTALCEQAEGLVLEPSVLVAFRKLQDLHEEWRECGPVAREVKDQLWERFKNASTIINKRHQEYFESVKTEQQANYNMKSELCDKAEAILEGEMKARQDWDNATASIIELQKMWKSIGFAPKKDNNAVYDRFRTACNKFFDMKQEHFSGMRNANDDNLQAKKSLCTQVEALQDSTDWQKTTNELIRLQAEWKKVGVTPRRESDELWKRFRTACDKFFAAKSAHTANIDSEYAENMKLKLAIIEELKNFTSNNPSEALNYLKGVQRRWMAIGFIHIKEKDRVQNEYKNLINSLFTSFKNSHEDISMDRFKEKVAGLKDEAKHGVAQEKDKLQRKLKKLEGDIILFENNIGFFSQSKNAQSLIKDVQSKIEAAKAEVVTIKEKIKILSSK